MEQFQHLKIHLEDIKLATNNFDVSNVIGEGSFGKVYKGVHSHSNQQIIVAYKRLNHNAFQGATEFWREIFMLFHYTHENLISLLGYCDEDGEKILMYEHACHGSLDQHLSSTSLTWTQRLNICLTAAMGLSYLHDPRETQQRVLHRDIKSSNILLDENWNSKVSDMGLSRIGIASQEHTILFTNAVGTFGYIDPMYAEKTILTKESDVYSFGVVLFEVLCGRLCYEFNDNFYHSLVRMWKQRYKERTLDRCIFEDMKQHMDPRSLDTFLEIAYQCVKKHPKKRPTMYQVVEKLEFALQFQETGTTLVHGLLYRSKVELKKLLSNKLLVSSVIGELTFIGLYVLKKIVKP